jgi:hypothetical protein
VTKILVFFSYECTVQNPLGTVTQKSQLMVEPVGVAGGTGNGSSDSGFVGFPDRTTSIIIIAVVICIAGTSLVWMVVICKTRRRQRHGASRHASLRPGDDFDVRKNSGNSSNLQPMIVPACRLADREFVHAGERASQPEVDSPLSLPPSDESHNHQVTILRIC